MKKLLIILSIAALVGCGKKEDPKPAVVEAAPTPSVDQAVDAILRSHPNSNQVCFDSKLHGFFLDYGPLLPAGSADDGKFHGWYWIDTPNFFLSANGKWFTQDLANDKYAQVYPDTTGLPCRQH